jgi:outer membrane protein assembly factor BamB
MRLLRTRTRRHLAPLLMAALCIVTAVVAAAPGQAAASGAPAPGAPVAVPAAISWPQFMFDARRSGFNAKEKAINRSTVNNLTLDYIAAGPADPEFGAFRGSAPAVVNGVAYLGDAIGNLVAFPATGCGLDVCAPLWTAQLSNGIHTSPAVDGGLVFVATSGNADNGLGQLYAFRAAGCGAPTCKPVWVAPQVPNTDSSPVTANGVVYIASSDGLLRAYAEAGCGQPKCRPLWTGNIGSSADASPAVDNGVVYVTSQDGLFAFAASGCAQTTAQCPPLWHSTPVDGIVQEVGPTVGNGMVYFATSNFSGQDGSSGIVYAFAAGGCGAAVCKPRFTARPAPFDNIVGTMAIAGGVLYASTSDFVYAFDANGCGTSECGFLWLGILSGTIAGTSASPIVAGGLVYFTQDNGNIGAFDARGCGDTVCTSVWSTNTQPFDALLDTPVVVNGRLYVAGPRFGDQSAMYVYHLPA